VERYVRNPRGVQLADLVLIGGGGLFPRLLWGVDPDTFLTGRHWGVAYYAGPAALATLYRKPAMLYAVGAGPLFSAHGIQFPRLAAQAAQAITVRDGASKTVLEEISIPSERIRVTADPALRSYPNQPPGSRKRPVPDLCCTVRCSVWRRGTGAWACIPISWNARSALRDRPVYHAHRRLGSPDSVPNDFPANAKTTTERRSGSSPTSVTASAWAVKPHVVLSRSGLCLSAGVRMRFSACGSTP